MTIPVLRQVLAHHRGAVLMLWVFSIFFNILVLTVPLYMMAVFSHVLTGRSQDTLLMLTIAAVFALAFQAGLDFIRSRLLIRLGVALDSALTPSVLEAIVRQAAGSATRHAQRLRDAAELRSFLTSPGIFNWVDAPFVPIYVFVIFMLHPGLGLLALAGMAVLVVIALVNELGTRAPVAAALKHHRSAHAQAEEFVRNADAIQAMGMMPGVLQRWHHGNSLSLAALSRGGDASSTTRALAKFTRILLQIGIYALGAYLYLRNEILVGAIVASSMLLGRALAPLEFMITSWKPMMGAWHAYRRVGAVLAPQRSGAGNRRGEQLAPVGALQLDRVVTAAPDSNRLILKGVSFSLLPGEFLGVIGPSGAGKSTLARVLVGVATPKAGSVRLDGVDLTAWHPDDLGTHVGYLPQDVQLFGGSVRHNIARLGDAHDLDSVVEVARRVGLHETILRLPDGYDTEIGEGGVRLSAGQRQHLGLARALFGKPRLVVLDEPNANLDATAEEALLGALEQARKSGVTLVVISHRPGILRAADKLLMLRNGSVELFGPRAAVMRQLTPAAAPRREPEAVAQPKFQVVQGEPT